MNSITSANPQKKEKKMQNVDIGAKRASQTHITYNTTYQMYLF